MYFAGINFALNSTQGVEALVAFSTIAYTFDIVRTQRNNLKRAESDGGPIQKDSTPKSLIGKLVTPVHVLAMSIPPILYIGSVLANKLTQPAWMLRWRLPLEVGAETEAWVRAAACLGLVGGAIGLRVIMGHLGKQFHPIAVGLSVFIFYILPF